ncbi:MAG: hypothetical protein M5U28_44120 [Sandaracinaceae bacterium]|nr:hypothetical protein [Sandaracinaceae bacterium]
MGPRFVGAFGALPRECDDITVRRLNTFTSDDLAGRSLPLPAATFCDPYAPEPGTPWLVGLDDGVGLLFRHGAVGEEEVHFARPDEWGRLAGPPRVVGGIPNLSSVDGGNQPRAVHIGHRMLFTERRGSENRCHAIRVMNDDGSGAGEAPWQLPCYGFADHAFVPERRITTSVELLPIRGGRCSSGRSATMSRRPTSPVTTRGTRGSTPCCWTRTAGAGARCSA